MIKKRKFKEFQGKSVYLKIRCDRNHIISFNSNGNISHKGFLESITPGKAYLIPKETETYVYLFHRISKENISIYIYAYEKPGYQELYNLVAKTINTLNNLNNIEIQNKNHISQSIKHYLLSEIKKHSIDKTKEDNEKNITKNIVEIINSDIKRKWNYKEICSLLFVSHSTLYRTLKNEGKTLKMIILNLRIINSKKLLVNTKMSINEISNRCGFNSPSYFCRKFKDSIKMSPTEYRRMNKKHLD